MSESERIYDVVIIGTGISGAIVAKQLAKLKKSVLLIEAGVAIPNGREELMERFYLDTAKLPETSYGENPNAPRAEVGHLLGAPLKGKPAWKVASRTYLDQSDSEIAFGSTYERRSGGTMWHWMGTSLRFVPNDFQLQKVYHQGVDWPISYDDLGTKVVSKTETGEGLSYYDLAEREIGVSADVQDQVFPGSGHFISHYPNPAIPLSRVDQFFQMGLQGAKMKFDGLDVNVIPTPAGRNSRPYQNRRVCAGNTNCVPICPIGAKYDPTVTLHDAFNLGVGRVEALFQHVAAKINRDPATNDVTGIECITYSDPKSRSPTGRTTVRGRIYVIAANAIEAPKLLLASGFKNRHIGCYLMDHPFYLRWGLTPKEKPINPYRGPLSTAGLDGLRDGEFRKQRAAFRIEIGNDGWALPKQDPYHTFLDSVDNKGLFGRQLLDHLDNIYSHQCRIGFEIEQLPQESNKVTLSDQVDALNLCRPKISYSLSEYEVLAFKRAADFATQLFNQLGVTEDDQNTLKKTDDADKLPASYAFDKSSQAIYPFMGAGHILGTHRMGTKPDNSVVNWEQRCWGTNNLYLVGGGVFPTCGTANPTLTIAALAFWAADTIAKQLG
jgi:choline dehydrogenase-like flavoprotein